MRANPLALFLPALFATSCALAQQSAEATSGAPDVTYPTSDAFIFCNDQNCQGTCEMVDGNTLLTSAELGEYLTDGMGFLSMYWYDPALENWSVYTSVNYYSSEQPVSIGRNTCYNLYNNAIPTYFYYYFYELN